MSWWWLCEYSFEHVVDGMGRGLMCCRGVFYPPVWVAWKDRKEEKARMRGGERGVELGEQRVGLMV